MSELPNLPIDARNCRSRIDFDKLAVNRAQAPGERIVNGWQGAMFGLVGPGKR